MTSPENQIATEELWSDLAAMESRITVLESQVAEALTAASRRHDESMAKDAVIAGDCAYVCLKYARGEACVEEGTLRRIGFDRCFEAPCPWVFKIE